MNGFKFVPYLLVIASLSACDAPRGAVLQRDIVKEANSQDAAFKLVEVNRTSLAKVSGWPATGQGLPLNWPAKSASQGARALRAGDMVNLTVWDSQANSLLASPEQRSVPMHGLTISPAGTIFVPYIDEVRVAGRSPEAARADIQERLTAIAPSAQVQLEVTEGEQNTIEIVSGVAKPGRYPVAAKGVTILSMLANAGGIPDSLRNPLVRLQRGGKAYAILASDLYRNPGRDILMRGGDRVVIESDPRSFVVLGAAASEKTVAFEKASHNLLEAISLSAGLQETRASIKGVMVMRKYPAKQVRADDKGPPGEQVIFTFDLGTGEGLFAARSFTVHPDDVVLATESPLPAASSVLGIFGNTLGVASRVNSM